MALVAFIYKATLFLNRNVITDDIYKKFGKKEADLQIKTLKREGKITQKGKNFLLTKKGRATFTVVMTGGVFDLLHLGHLATLEEVQKLGDLVVVVVARDIWVAKKKRKTTYTEEERVKILNSLSFVDLAILGDKQNHLLSVKKVNPDIIAIGKNQNYKLSKLKEDLESQGLDSIKIIRLNSNIDGYSTTETISRVFRNNS